MAKDGMPCCFVQTDKPEELFVIPNHNGSSLSRQEFQPLSLVRKLSESGDAAHKNWASLLDTHDYLLGGTGPIPTLSEYVSWLRKLKPDAHIVQIGANEGGDEENEWVHHILLENAGWSATVIEPVPFLYARLARNYEELRGRVEPIQMAVSTRDGWCEMYAATPQTRERALQQISTMALGNAAQGTRCFTDGRPCRYVRRALDRGELSRISVRCMTLTSLLKARRQHRGPVDLLVIDAEMFDYTLLRSINMRAIGPLAIEFESKTMSVQQGREIAALLALQGYLCRFAPDGTWDGKRWWNHMKTARGWGNLKASESVCYRMV